MLNSLQTSFRRILTQNLRHVHHSTKMTQRPVETGIKAALETLQPIHLEIVNESFMHNVPPESESHFKVLIVSEQFEGLALLKRHRMVNNLVKDTLGDMFPHAFSIEAKTPTQWQESYKMDPSPNCRGGFGK